MAGKTKSKQRGAKASKRPPARGQRGPRKAQIPPSSSLWLYGRHAVAAALGNPARPIRRVMASESALSFLAETNAPPELIARATPASPQEIDQILPDGAVHQGIAAEVDDLPRTRLRDVCAEPAPGEIVVILDQITDPQNIGAIFRSAAAFGARAVIAQDRRTPPLAGALAKAAAGAIETVPFVSVVNIARALEGLQGLGWHCAGLAGQSATPIGELPTEHPIAIVLGAEGDGLRQLVATTCNALYRIPIASDVESLNVSNAAAIAFYEATHHAKSVS